MQESKKEIRGKGIFRRTFLALLLLGVGCIFVISQYQVILTRMGKFLAPEGTGKADVVILEGTEVVREDAVRIGIEMLSSRRAQGLVLVYQNSEDERIFARVSDYIPLLIQQLEVRGLRKDQVKVILVPKVHPLTLNEAQIVLSSLSKDGVRSAILVAEEFHTRRSYWIYKGVGKPLGIEIIPCPYFSRYQCETCVLSVSLHEIRW